MEFETTALLVAAVVGALLVPAMILHRRRGRPTAAVRFSSTEGLRRARRTLRHRLRHAVAVLRVLAILFLLAAIARPRKGEEITEVTTQGIAIQMVLDRSGSMEKYEMRYRGEWRTRLDVVKEVFREFVQGNGDDLPGRKNDLIGLTTFARFAEEECPLTLDHATLVAFSDSLVAATGYENMTAIGDALYQAALSLVVADDYVRETLGKEQEYRITSKVIVLLTDGEQNVEGSRLPTEAARFAKENGIKIYTIAITGGEERGRGALPFGLSFGQRIDTRQIRHAAEIAGGLYQEATDGESLERIYAKIDELERSEFKESFRRYREFYQVPVIAALVCVSLEVLLAATWLRRIP